MLRPIRSIAGVVAISLVLTACANSASTRPDSAELARACDDIPEAHDTKFLGDLREDVDRVAPVREMTKTKPLVEQLVGVDIHVRATREATPQWLARVVSCRLAQDASLARVSTRVSGTRLGFTIELRSDDPDVVAELLRRAEPLVAKQ